MQDDPKPEAILAAVTRFLSEDVMPKLSGDTAFGLRVAINALGLVGRALERQPASDAAEQARLEALLGVEGDLETLNHLLTERLRGGSLALSSPGVAAHLLAVTMEKLAVDQPTYATYRRRLEQNPAPGAQRHGL